MRILISGLVVVVSISVNADIVGTAWVGQPKISHNGKLLCSPDLNDKPEWRPMSHGMPYIDFHAGSDGWFWIHQGDRCSSWFGFDSGGYLFQARGNDVFDVSGVRVGTISSQKLEIQGTGYRNTRIQKLVFEILPNGHAKFSVKFENSGRPGQFEMTSGYTKYQP